MSLIPHIMDFNLSRQFGKWILYVTHPRPGISRCDSFVGFGSSRLQAPCWHLFNRQSSGRRVSLTRPVLESVHRVRSLFYSSRTGICLVVRDVGTFCFTPRPGICLLESQVREVYFTRSAMASVVRREWEFLLIRPLLAVCLVFCRVGQFLSDTSPVL